MAHAVAGEERVILNLYTRVATTAYSARLQADDRRPARGAPEPRDVDFHVDEACRAHRPGHHARSVIKIPRDRTRPDESPAGP